jgi:hypothetical protein
VKLNSVPVGQWNGALILLPPLNNDEPDAHLAENETQGRMGNPAALIFSAERFAQHRMGLEKFSASDASVDGFVICV